MKPRDRQLINLGFGAGWDAHEAYLSCSPVEVKASCKAGQEAVAAIQRELDKRARAKTVLTHYVSAPDRNGMRLSVCGKAWKPNEQSISEGKCETCIAIVEAGWVK